jgi:ADP-ribose pyrophosphatase YjhB (NUDIX family)
MNSLSNYKVETLQDLENIISNWNDIPEKYSVAVEGLVFDLSNNWILMKRGQGCRDEIGKLEGIGGRFDDDKDFRSALKREISEEVGDDANIEILSFFEIRKDTVESPISKEQKHWIIVSFICLLKSGNLKIMEPQKNSGFITLLPQNAVASELSSSAASAALSLQEKWDEILDLLRSAHS